MKSLMYIFGIMFLISVVLLAYAFAGTEVKTNEKKDLIEANVWVTDDGQKHFECPVMGGKGIVDEKTTYSDLDGKRYYHCCGGCSEKFLEDPSKYLQNFSVPGNVIMEDKDGRHFQCPVSGEMGTVSEKTKYSDMNGKRYYFCCEKCKTVFDKDSEKYLVKKD